MTSVPFTTWSAILVAFLVDDGFLKCTAGVLVLASVSAPSPTSWNCFDALCKSTFPSSQAHFIDQEVLLRRTDSYVTTGSDRIERIFSEKWLHGRSTGSWGRFEVGSFHPFQVNTWKRLGLGSKTFSLEVSNALVSPVSSNFCLISQVWRQKKRPFIPSFASCCFDQSLCRRWRFVSK